MPISYRTPGVYIEWLDANPQRLELGRSDVAGLVGVCERGPVQTPVKIESERQFLTTFGDRVTYGYLAYAVAGFFQNGGRTCWVVRVADPVTSVRARVRLSVNGRTYTFEASSPGEWGNNATIAGVWGRDRVIALVVNTPDGRTQTIDLDDLDAPPVPAGDRPLTNLLGVSDDALPELAPEAVVSRVDDDPLALPIEIQAGSGRIRLAGGADGLASLTPNHFTGDPDRDGVWGVAALERVRDVSFLAVPDLSAGEDLVGRTPGFAPLTFEQIQDAQTAIITSCLRTRDRIAILDVPLPLAKASRPQDVGRWAIRYRAGLPNSSCAALYYPWIAVDDPLRLGGAARMIPPSGHVAGMFARVDRLRGVHKPPANEVLEGVFDVRDLIDDAAHGDLNDAGVNAIRAIPGRDILVLGTRTLDTDIRWRYVNVRRLFTTIERSLEQQMQWLTFEPNNPSLWRDIDRALRGLLERLYRAGMLDGRSPDEAFVVRCDESTNPETETDEGRVTCVIGIQPPYPAEFVVVRIGVTRSGIEVEEKGAQDV